MRLGLLLGRTRTARACMDLSDGLADALEQLTAASRVGAVVDADAVPVEPGAERLFTARGNDPLAASLAGEDYELLFTAPPRARRSLAAIGRMVRDAAPTRIGVITRERRVVLQRDGVEVPFGAAGYEHFRAGA